MQTSNPKPDIPTELQMSRGMSNTGAFHFRAPACINQGRLGCAVTKNTLVSEVYHMSASCSLCMSKLSQQEALLCTPAILVPEAEKQTLKNCKCTSHGLTCYWLEVVTPPCQGSWETSAHHLKHKQHRGRSAEVPMESS